MPEVNYDWAKAQMTGAGVRQGPGDAVLELLKTWEKISLSAELAADAVEVFTSLAKQEALIKTPGDQVWVQSTPGGGTRTGDIVRVKHNAFTGEAGLIHNGRLGKVVAIRSGDVIFRSTDGLDPFLDGTHFPFIKLEKRVR